MVAGPHTPPTAPRTLPGRRAELELLEREFALARSGEARFILLVGEAGVGKTRLLREAARRSDMVVLDLHAPPERLGSADLLNDWLAPLLSGGRRVGVQDLALVTAAYPRLSELNPLARPLDSEEIAPARVLPAIARLMAHAAERRPLLFLVDDLPRLRQEVRSLVAELSCALAGAPVAFLATARRDRRDPLRDRALAPLVERHLLRRVDVLPLDKDGIRELVAAELDAGIVPDLLPWLYAKSSGNALFAVELIRTLEGQGILYVERESGSWRVAGQLGEVSLPETIAHVLDSRLRTLPPDIAGSLRVLALLGADAPTRFLASALGVDAAAVEGILKQLARAGVLERRDKNFAFAHPLMSEHWRSELNERERHRLAGQALDGILDEVNSREGGVPGLEGGSCASGLELAQDDELGRILVYGNAAERHVDYLLAALEVGRRSLDALRPREAATWARRGSRRLSRITDPVRYRWLRSQLDYLMGTALYQQGRVPAAEAWLRRFSRAPEAGDIRFGIQVFPRLGQLLIKHYRPEEARRVLEAGLEKLDSLPEQSQPLVASSRCEILCYLARLQTTRGDLDGAEAVLERATNALGDVQSDARAAEDSERILVERAVLATRRGDYRQAIADFEQLVDLGRLRSTAIVSRLQGLAIYLAIVGDLGRARATAFEALQSGKRTQDRAAEATVWSYIGLIEGLAGNWREAAAAQSRARELAERVGDRLAWYLAMGESARARQMLEGNEASDRTWQEALAGSPTVGAADTPHLFHLFWARAWVLCRRQDWDGASDACEQAKAHLRRPQPRNEAEIEILGLEVEARRLLAARQAVGGAGIKTGGAGVQAGAVHAGALRRVAERLDGLESYLRQQHLRAELVDLARVRLFLTAAGWQGARPEALLAEIETLLREMDAPARLADVAREFVDTSVASLPRFHSTFAAALSSGLSSRPEPSGERVPRKGGTVELVQPEIPHDRLRIHALGRLEVTRAGEDEPMTRSDWGSRKARLLLAYFLAKDLEGRGVARDALFDAVWPDSESFTLDHTFRVTMNLVRKALQPGARDTEASEAAICDSGTRDKGARLLAYKNGLYLLDYEALWCDVREFELALREAAASERRGEIQEAHTLRRRAFDLYRGEFLSDFDEIWIEPRRERYRSRFVEIGCALFESALASRSLHEAQEFAEKLVSCDAVSEEGHRLLIRAYLASGQRDAASRQLERCRAIIGRELGLSVSEETESLLKPAG